MKASQKEVVEALMKYLGKKQRDVKGKQREFVIYECMKPTCATRKIFFQAGAGYKNPYRHLKDCYGRGRTAEEQERVIHGIYSEVQQTSACGGGTISSHFRVDTLYDYENAVNSYVQLIILESCLLTIVYSPV